MDITGVRWGLDGCEAVLKLRAIVGSGDFAQYWRYHLTREHERVHFPLRLRQPSPPRTCRLMA